MPLHSVQLLPTGARLGLWHLQEAPTDLWPQLPEAAAYRARLPPTTDPNRLAQWLAARVLLHQLLAQFELPPAHFPTPPSVVNDAQGRPRLAGWPAAAVSLSHSGQWVAALLAPGGRAGVDVEVVRDKARRIAGRFLSDKELAEALAPGTDPAIFSLLWSAKETLYKLAGQRGLIFRKDILTDPVAPFFFAQTAGELSATLPGLSGQTRHRVCYVEPAPGYVLTYSHEPPSTPSLLSSP